MSKTDGLANFFGKKDNLHFYIKYKLIFLITHQANRSTWTALILRIFKLNSKNHSRE